MICVRLPPAARLYLPFHTTNLANMPIRNGGDCGAVWAC